MKKFIFTIVLLFIINPITFAQDLNSWVSELSLVENAQYQYSDKATIEAYLAAVSGGIPITLPPLMQRLESIDIISLIQCSSKIKELFLKKFEEYKDENGYETLMNTVKNNAKVRIIARKEGTTIPQVFIFGIDAENEEIVIIRMTGKMDESDIADIIKQQQK